MEIISQYSNMIAGGACGAANGTRKKVIKCRGLVRIIDVEENFDKKAVMRRVENVRKEIRYVSADTDLAFRSITVSSIGTDGKAAEAAALWGGICSLEPLTVSLSLRKSEQIIDYIKKSRMCLIHDGNNKDIILKIRKMLVIGGYITLIAEVENMPKEKDNLNYLVSDLSGNMKFLNSIKAHPYMYKNE